MLLRFIEWLLAALAFMRKPFGGRKADRKPDRSEDVYPMY
jgi:hypothetical protein